MSPNPKMVASKSPSSAASKLPPFARPSALSDDLIVELLEVCTHNILFMRRVYPFGIFQQRRLYNCVVYRSRYPALNEYIANALRAAQFLLAAGLLRKFEVVLAKETEAALPADGDNKLESYFFEVPPRSAAAAKSGGLDAACADYELLDVFEEQMRAILLTLDAKCKNLPELPQRVVFTVQLHTYQSGQVKITDNVKLEDFPWICQENNGKEEPIIVPLADVSGIQIIAASYM